MNSFKSLFKRRQYKIKSKSTSASLQLALLGNFRVILVVNPLHYKRLITKRRLHVAFTLAFLFFLTNVTCYFIFLRQERFIVLKECAVLHVLQYIGYLLMTSCSYTYSILMFLNSIIITVKLRKRKTVALGSKTGTQINDDKMTHASWMTLKLFLSFVVPSTLLGVVSNFLQEPYPVFYYILLDLSYLLFYMNNVVNPFVYYVFLKDFRDGYQALLCCRMKGIYSRNTSRSMSLPPVTSSAIQVF